MDAQIEQSEKVLRDFSLSAIPVVDRPQVVAHATLSALAHHWPSRTSDKQRSLLEATAEIKRREHSRWAVQRRIAIAKLARHFRESEAPPVEPALLP